MVETMRNLTWIFLLIGIGFQQCKSAHSMSHLHTHAFRLRPGDDLRQSIQQWVNDKQIKAGWISTAVGSLTHYELRLANQSGSSTGDGHFEIVSLTGTVSVNGSHLHISLADSTGRTLGGHLLNGCRVYTTAEIVILSDDGLEFSREKDGSTPWEELQIRTRP